MRPLTLDAEFFHGDWRSGNLVTAVASGIDSADKIEMMVLSLDT